MSEQSVKPERFMVYGGRVTHAARRVITGGYRDLLEAHCGMTQAVRTRFPGREPAPVVTCKACNKRLAKVGAPPTREGERG